MIVASVFISALLALSVAPQPADATGEARKRVLVLVDDLATAERTHTTFLGQISSLGFDVTTALSSSEEVSLQVVDQWQYDHLVVLGAESKFGEGVTAKKQLEFFESGRDVYLAINPSSTGNARALAGRFGADMEPKSSIVVDPFENLGSMTMVKAVVDADAVEYMLPETKSEVVFVDGVGFSVAPEARMTVGALHGSPTAFSSKEVQEGAVPRPNKLGGYNLKLAGFIQGRNNARAAVVGSTAMLSDAVLGSHQGNRAFAKDSLAWVLGQRGVLKSSQIRHKKVGGDAWNPAEGYRVKDEVEVYVDISECTNGTCGPYGGNDVQIELRMLDPYIRKTMTNSGNGTFAATMMVPDVYGVFKFQVDYTRPGLSWVHESSTFPIRPFRHDEYPRFLSQAYPYYASVVSMVLGFLMVSSAFVFGTRNS